MSEVMTRSAGIRTEAPGPVKAIRYLLGFLGVTATAGGIAMMVGIGGEEFMPTSWLEGVPLIHSWFVPGLVLAIGFGLGSLFVLWASIMKPDWPGNARPWGRHWSWSAIVLIGLGHMAWIGLQVIFLTQISPLQFIYGAIGVALFVLPFVQSVRTHFDIE